MKQVSVEVFEEVAYAAGVVSRTCYEPEGFSQNFYLDGKLVAVYENYDVDAYLVHDDA
ncbi:hypothetical protein 65p007c [Aeromonas phage 65]|uniref:Uncharacterized protein n=2 Tax=Ishigurovirus osborne TaxID=260149 RepID=A0A219YBN7_9CAUD|nr:hypothetical protein ST65p007c [Aeromonas phage 65]AAR90931.1 hypothetical protein 65p007c [Aeromonas phage 65]APU01399.1 hypothetical protein [Aeromonas phage 65.2]